MIEVVRDLSAISRHNGARNRRVQQRRPSAPAPLVPPGTPAFWVRGDMGIIPNGGNASGWNDQTANALHVAQATPANQPLIASPWKNGIPALTFDAVSDVLTRATGFFAAGSALTIFVVGQMASDPDVVDAGSNNAPWWGLQSVAGNDAFFITRYNGVSRFVAWTGGAGPTIAGNFGIGTNPCYLVWSTDGSGGAANLTFRANGVAKVTSGALADTTNISLNMMVGNGTAFSGKTIGEVIVHVGFNTLITETETYITSFWGAF